MNQQINLYQPIFREERKLFSLKTVAASLAIVSVSLLAMWGFGAHNVGKLAAAVVELQQQQAVQERMVQAAGVILDAQGSPAAAQAKVQTLSARLAERTSALNLLRSGAAGQPKGFAPRLSALARQHTEGVWLDQLLLGSGAGGLLLRGRSVDAELIPKYLQTLTTEPALSGARFDMVEIDRREHHDSKRRDANRNDKPQAESNTVRFSVSSSALSIPEEQGS